MQVFSSTRKRREFILLSVTAVVLTAIAFSQLQPLLSEVSNPEQLQQFALELAPYGPGAIILLQFAQVLLAPIPPFTPVVSGFIYGTIEGTFYSVIGAALGSLTAILLARKYGRPMVEKFLSDEAMEKFDKYTSGHGFLPFIVLFTFPGFPDDALCFIAGLTDLDWKKLFLISSIGRIPGIAMLAATGSSIANLNKINFLILATAIAAISYLSVKYEEKLEEIVAEIEAEERQLASMLNSRFGL